MISFDTKPRTSTAFVPVRPQVAKRTNYLWHLTCTAWEANPATQPNLAGPPLWRKVLSQSRDKRADHRHMVGGHCHEFLVEPKIAVLVGNRGLQVSRLSD